MTLPEASPPGDAPAVPGLTATGERLMTDNRGPNVPEHLHRYALACELATDRDVIDVASGEGFGSMLLAAHARSVVGVDVAADAVAHARAKYVRKNLRFLEASATALPLPAACVDLAVSFETIEHLHDHDAMLGEIRRVLRPGGRLIMSSPDRRYYTDATGHANPFHERELYAAEFLGLIGRFFRHVRPLVQRIVHGSLIVPVDGRMGFTEYRGDFTSFTADPTLREAMYVIVVAADDPLPEWPLSLWEAGALLAPPAPPPPPPAPPEPPSPACAPPVPPPPRRRRRTLSRLWRRLRAGPG